MQPITLDEAENDLRAAYLDGDPVKIAAAEAVVDRLDVHSTPSLLSSALWYVERGFPVFPLQPGRKAPWGACEGCKGGKCPGPETCGHPTCHGLKDATLDPARINAWWTEKPQANIGVATGHVMDVIDVDGPKGQMSRTKHWEDIFGRIDADSFAKVLTPRPGGMHIYVPPTGDGSGTEIVPGVDYRGMGGYVVMPPSVILPGSKDHAGTYRFLGTPDFNHLTTPQVA